MKAKKAYKGPLSRVVRSHQMHSKVMDNRRDLSKVGGDIWWDGKRLFDLATSGAHGGRVVDDPRNYDKLKDQYPALYRQGRGRRKDIVS